MHTATTTTLYQMATNSIQKVKATAGAALGMLYIYILLFSYVINAFLNRYYTMMATTTKTATTTETGPNIVRHVIWARAGSEWQAYYMGVYYTV